VRSSPVATHSTLQELYEVTRRNLAPDGQIASDGVQDVARALSRRQHQAAWCIGCRLTRCQSLTEFEHPFPCADAVSLRDLGLSAGLAEVSSQSSPCTVPLETLDCFALEHLEGQWISSQHALIFTHTLAAAGGQRQQPVLKRAFAAGAGKAARVRCCCVPSPFRACSTCSAQHSGVQQAAISTHTHVALAACSPGAALCRRKIGYTEIHHGEDMTIAIFHLPPGTIIPLHDHPGMTVFSR
jgi:hypothetical protein